jgi:16S rRNA (uracil1498-N3)-methyltransferase
MIQLFLLPEKLASPDIIISGKDARYLSHILRVKPGDHLAILDGLGTRHICVITAITSRQVTARKVREEPCSAESPLSITLVQGMPKGRKMDFIIQKSTELGIKRIIPLITDRTIVKDTGKVSRWIKIARSAAQQSGREQIPEVHPPAGFREFIKGNRSAILSSSLYRGIILWESETESTFRTALKSFRQAREITLMVGPEGGFSQEEVHAALENGFIAASLGPRILRTETAPLSALSIIQYDLGDMG